MLANRSLGALLGAVAVLACSACGSSDATEAGSVPAAPACPVAPVPVVVSVNPWTDVVERLAGACAEVTTIVTGASGDPHEYEPTPADASALDDAKVVVVNGAGYDTWASDALAGATERRVVVDAAEVVGVASGDNPHIWYRPDAVSRVAAAVTTALGQASPGATAYFAAAATRWSASFQPLLDAVERLQAAKPGATYVATESVFDPMAESIGLRDVTPAGFRNAAANESEPAPGDVHDVEATLTSGSADVLVFNRQTAGAVPEQLEQTARRSGVPVVEVTETMPSGAGSFVDWQLAQLEQLEAALR